MKSAALLKTRFDRPFHCGGIIRHSTELLRLGLDIFDVHYFTCR